MICKKSARKQSFATEWLSAAEYLELRLADIRAA
jgi:hypothetical protein